MEKYLILSDMDKTLLNNKSKLSKKTIKYLQEIIDDGHIFALCTGRPYQGAISFFNQINRDIPMVTDNGANIYFPKQNKNHSWDIPLNTFKELILETKDMYKSLIYNGQKTIYVENIKDVPSFVIHQENGMSIKEGKMIDIALEVPSFIMYYLKAEYYDEFMKIIENYKEIRMRIWGPNNKIYSIELFNKDVSKGNALKYLKDLYSIKDDHTMGFGDQMNDFELLEAAYFGVAMKNATPQIKKMATYVTHFSNNHNGVIKFIKHHLK